MPAEFTLRQLQYFVAVLDAGSVTDAARNSNITQAAASMAIAQLERALGVELLLRTAPSALCQLLPAKRSVPGPGGSWGRRPKFRMPSVLAGRNPVDGCRLDAWWQSAPG